MASHKTPARSLSLLALPLLVAAGVLVPAAPAQALVDVTTTFDYSRYGGGQVDWVVPADATELVVTVAGGVADDGYPSMGRGGVVTVPLDDIDYAGKTLNILAGRMGKDCSLPSCGTAGGEGSYLGYGSDFLVVAGGGGRAGNAEGGASSTLAGGDGGAGAAAATAGADHPTVVSSGVASREGSTTASGGAASGFTPGVSAPGAATGTVASISGGVITPGMGGAAGDPTAGAGGGGYAGGGGGSLGHFDDIYITEYGAGGGGSGFLAPGLTATSTGFNTDHGYVTFSYKLPGTAPDVTTAPGVYSAQAGDAFTLPIVATGYPTPTVQLTGDLPAGVSFDEATSTLSGTPTEAGTFPYTFRASNGQGPDATVYRTLVVTPGALTALALTPSAASVARGGTLTFTVTGTDVYSNDVGDISSQVTLSSDVATDIVSGLSVTFPHASPHTITVTGLGLSATFVVDVLPTLAATGTQPGALPTAGFASLLLGFGLIVWSRLRRRRVE